MQAVEKRLESKNNSVLTVLVNQFWKRMGDEFKGSEQFQSITWKKYCDLLPLFVKVQNICRVNNICYTTNIINLAQTLIFKMLGWDKGLSLELSPLIQKRVVVSKGV